MTDVFEEDGKLKARLGITEQHPEFPDETSESYLIPHYKYMEIVEDLTRLRAERDQLSVHNEGLQEALEFEQQLAAHHTEENERLRAELARILPSWDDAPEWVNYRIISPHGHLLWCESIPEKADYLRDIPQTRMVSIFCKEPIIEERPK